MGPKEQWQSIVRQHLAEEPDQGVAWAVAEIERLRSALARIARSCVMVKRSCYVTQTDAIDHIMRLSQYAEDALESPPPPPSSAGAPEGMPPRETKGTT